MGFRLVKTGKSYTELDAFMREDVPNGACVDRQAVDSDSPSPAGLEPELPPRIIWKGTPNEYRSMLVLSQAELLLANAQLTGNAHADWYLNNKISDLESKIADLKKWLTDAKE
jgi:hypothetical protein